MVGKLAASIGYILGKFESHAGLSVSVTGRKGKGKKRRSEKWGDRGGGEIGA